MLIASAFLALLLLTPTLEVSYRLGGWPLTALSVAIAASLFLFVLVAEKRGRRSPRSRT